MTQVWDVFSTEDYHQILQSNRGGLNEKCPYPQDSGIRTIGSHLEECLGDYDAAWIEVDYRWQQIWRVYSLALFLLILLLS